MITFAVLWGYLMLFLAGGMGLLFCCRYHLGLASRFHLGPWFNASIMTISWWLAGGWFLHIAGLALAHTTTFSPHPISPWVFQVPLTLMIASTVIGISLQWAIEESRLPLAALIAKQLVLLLFMGLAAYFTLSTIFH